MEPIFTIIGEGLGQLLSLTPTGMAHACLLSSVALCDIQVRSGTTLLIARAIKQAGQALPHSSHQRIHPATSDSKGEEGENITPFHRLPHSLLVVVFALPHTLSAGLPMSSQPGPTLHCCPGKVQSLHFQMLQWLKESSIVPITANKTMLLRETSPGLECQESTRYLYSDCNISEVKI